jgi:hypothetical protein
MLSRSLLLSVCVFLSCTPAMAKSILRATAEHSGILKINQKLVSPNKTFHVVMQSDGNLVVYSKHQPPGCPTQSCVVWNSKTNGPQANFSGRYFAAIQGDGHLVVYRSAKGDNVATSTPLYVSNPSLPTGDYFLAMQNDGNLVIYQGAPEAMGDAMWSSQGGKLY